MCYFKLQQPPGAPHLPVKLLKVLGIGGQREIRLRMLPVILTYLFAIAIPKIIFGYPTFEVAIIGIAELIYQTNSFGGAFLLFLHGDKIEQFYDHTLAFARKITRTSSADITNFLTAKHSFIHKIVKIYFFIILYGVQFYVFAPFVSTLCSFYSSMRNPNKTIQYNMHMEGNFYGLATRTSALDYLIFGIVMIPTCYLCALTATVKIITLGSFIKYNTVYFQIVQLKLQEIARNKTFQQELPSLIQIHQDALNCAKLLESMTSLNFLLQIILCVLIWSSMLLYFTVSGFSIQLLNLLILFVIETVETTAYSYLGTQLSEESAGVARTIYESCWEKQNAVIQKDLQLMLLRAQRPIGITAGRFCFMNMEMFGKVVKSTYSFYIILRDQFQMS